MNQILPVLVILSFSLMVEGAVYKWTDEHGRIHYSDRPVDEKSEQVDVVPSPKTSHSPPEQVKREEKRQRLLEIYQEERAKKQAAVEKQQREKAENKQKCRQAQRRYAKFNHAGGIYDRDENGERRYLAQNERARFIASLQAEIDRWCSK